MKRILFILSLTILCGCFGKKSTIVTGLEGKPMPAYNLLLMDSVTQLNTGHIPAGKPAILFLFSPYCPYCRAQVEDIVKHIKSFEGIKIYMISSFPFPIIKSFY